MNYNYKPYDIAMLCGRFQIIHEGHENLINTGLSMADRMLILVGSSQEQGTERNPFDVGTRIKMIKEIYPYDNVIVKPLPDLTNENDICFDWGKYVIKNTKQFIYKLPELMIYGNDDSRSGWFDKDDIKDITEIIVSRSKIGISATEMRDLIVKDNKGEWFKHHNQKLHKYYDSLRGMLMQIDYYKELLNK